MTTNDTMTSQANIKTHTYLEYIGHNGQRVPRDYWSNKKNVKIYMDWLAKREGYTTMEDFYKIKKDTFKNNFGGKPWCNKFSFWAS